MTIRPMTRLIASVATAITLGGAAMADTTLRIATTLPDGNAIVTGILQPWADHVNAAGTGVEVSIVNGATIANGANVLDRVADGIVDGGWVLPGYTGKPFPKALVVGLPFLATTPAEGTAGINAVLDAGLLDDEFSSVHVLGLATIPTNGLHTKEPVESLEDAAGLKLRVADKIGATLAQEMGASGISMPITEAYQAISQGVVDGIITGWTGLFVFKLNEVVDNYLEVPLGQQPASVLINPDSWAGLTDEQKAVLATGPEGVPLGTFIGNWYTRSDSFFRGKILEGGGTLNELSDEQQAEWRETLQPVTDNWIAETENGQEVLDTFKAGVATTQ